MEVHGGAGPTPGAEDVDDHQAEGVDQPLPLLLRLDHLEALFTLVTPGLLVLLALRVLLTLSVLLRELTGLWLGVGSHDSALSPDLLQFSPPAPSSPSSGVKQTTQYCVDCSDLAIRA